jgi:hypothetical protein
MGKITINSEKENTMPILRLSNKEYNVTLLDKNNNPFFLTKEKEKTTLDISKTIDPKSDTDTMKAILYKYLKNTKIKFKDIKIREI